MVGREDVKGKGPALRARYMALSTKIACLVSTPLITHHLVGGQPLLQTTTTGDQHKYHDTNRANRAEFLFLLSS